MEKDLLQAVIKVEKEIQESVESERKKAAKWLESVRIAADRKLEEKKQQLLARYDQSLDETCRTSKKKAEQEIAEAHQFAEYLIVLPENEAEEVVAEFLQQVLPGKQGAEK